MARYIEVILKKRAVHSAALLLDKEAPRTSEAIWKALPLEGDVFHAKYASNEIYTLVAPFAEPELELENYTLMPFTGEIMYFRLRPWHRLPRAAQDLQAAGRGSVDLAIFYDRDNFLFSPKLGPIPGSIFARIVTNMEGMTQACQSVWREGAVGERLVFQRLEGARLKELGVSHP
jgi:hypothetical protein